AAAGPAGVPAPDDPPAPLHPCAMSTTNQTRSIGETGSARLQKRLSAASVSASYPAFQPSFGKAQSRNVWSALAADAAGIIEGMPTISRFFGIAIVMFFDDHGFPHFHARHAEGEAKVRIDNLEVMDSDLGRRQLRFVLAWAELHQEELEENWRRARAGETLLDIEPLK
ncbi:MAG: DUF4160 domain-containing protein, partial [Actinomycetota bacterium]|nr:DUF4160 domain-containing protein [Actinomycetota bacterium]